MKSRAHRSIEEENARADRRMKGLLNRLPVLCLCLALACAVCHAWLASGVWLWQTLVTVCGVRLVNLFMSPDMLSVIAETRRLKASVERLEAYARSLEHGNSLHNERECELAGALRDVYDLCQPVAPPGDLAYALGVEIPYVIEQVLPDVRPVREAEGELDDPFVDN